MNDTQQEQLFTDLTSIQAETITAGAIDPGGGPISVADASYGEASASFSRTGDLSAFKASLFVLDDVTDGYSVYAKLHGQTPNGRTLIGTRKYFDSGRGSLYTRNDASFGKNVLLKRVRVAIYRNGRAPILGNWVNL